MLVGEGTYIEISYNGRVSAHPVEWIYGRIMREGAGYLNSEGEPLVVEYAGKEELVVLQVQSWRYKNKGDSFARIAIGRDVWVQACEAGFRSLGYVSGRELLQRPNKSLGYLQGSEPLRMKSSKAQTIEAYNVNASILAGVHARESARDTK